MDNNKKKLVGAGAALLVLLLAAGGWWFLRSPEPQPVMVTANINGKPTTIPVQLASLGLKDGKVDISAMLKNAMAMQQKKMDDYAKLSAEEKKKFLDAEIDAQEKMRKDNAAFNPATRPDGTTTDTGPNGEKRVVIKSTLGGGEKGMMEDVDPMLRAQLQQFKKDMMQRRAERGLPESAGGMMMRIQVTK